MDCRNDITVAIVNERHTAKPPIKDILKEGKPFNKGQANCKCIIVTVIFTK